MIVATDFGVTPYWASQYDEVCALLRGAGWQAGAIPSPLLLLQAGQASFVARSPSGEVIGFARILTDGLLVSYLSEIVVSPGWQGQGVGRALIDACRMKHPTARLDLLSTIDAQRFYEHIGFTAKAGYRIWPA